ncbi:MAG: PEP-CTERM sorting domain-containing protein [Fimbriimonadaceae bacterium]
MINSKTLTVLVGITTLSLAAQADLVKITLTGNVDFNVIQGSMAGVASGAPVSMSFNVDSNNFLNSLSFPTRGYTVIDSSFVMTVDGRPVTFDNPQPDSYYFVLRNNDPTIDGFFMSAGPDLPSPASVHIPGLSPAHELNVLHTFTDGSVFNSLNILDAVGTYDLAANVSVYNWGIGRFGNNGAEYTPSQLKIETVPEPATMTILGLGLLAAAQKRKK